jgi:hypothetical protein
MRIKRSPLKGSKGRMKNRKDKILTGIDTKGRIGEKNWRIRRQNGQTK